MAIRVAVDVMGGDRGSAPAVDGAVAAAQDFAIPVLLVGDGVVIRSELGKIEGEKPRVEVRHAPQVVGMDESPSRVVRQKRDSSIAAQFAESGLNDVLGASLEGFAGCFGNGKGARFGASAEEVS